MIDDGLSTDGLEEWMCVCVCVSQEEKERNGEMKSSNKPVIPPPIYPILPILPILYPSS